MSKQKKSTQANPHNDIPLRSEEPKIESSEKGKKHSRGWHQGTIQDMPNGKKRIIVTLENGKRVSKVCKTETECNRWAIKIQANPELISPKPILTPQKPPENGPKLPTVGRWFEEWLVQVKTSIRDTTYTDYARYTNEHIIPEFGDYALTELTLPLIEDFYVDLTQEGYPAPTVRYIHRVFHRGLAVARKRGLVTHNPADDATIPALENKEMMFLNEQQVHILLITVKGHEHDALYDIAVKAGPREAELLGLKWQDVDFVHATMSIQRQAKRVKGKGIQLRALKTKSSRRTIHIGEATLNLLRHHKVQQETRKLETGEAWQENDLIFPSSIGTPMDQSNLVAEFKAILEIAGLPEIRFHDLRHTAASIMIKYLKDIFSISRTLGHSKPSTTMNIYGHLMPGVQESGAKIIDEALTPLPITGIGIEEIGVAVLKESEWGMGLTRAHRKGKTSRSN